MIDERLNTCSSYETLDKVQELHFIERNESLTPDLINSIMRYTHCNELLVHLCIPTCVVHARIVHGMCTCVTASSSTARACTLSKARQTKCDVDKFYIDKVINKPGQNNFKCFTGTMQLFFTTQLFKQPNSHIVKISNYT